LQPTKVSRSAQSPQDRALLGNIGNTTLWRWVKERPDFPRPLKLGPRTSAWRASDIDKLIASL
jgi:predicted DNA-binding transcriptional regulator AlpA